MITRTQAIRLLEEAGCAPNVIKHCKEVASLAVEISVKAKAAGNDVNLELVEAGALLHDVGRCRTHGISHAVEGFRLAQSKGVEPEVVEIIKRHIGAGVSKEEAKELGLPEDDYFPRSLEEKIVAHADNLIKGTKRITINERLELMSKKNIPEYTVQRVKKLAEEVERISR
ncbi:metal-dependent phosphohydrolase [Methanosarcina siciliae C2J]|uniref:Metal-dependent phosphohydrolase n=3 Tax=Methanosarcina siciliae TaxID=38027 RepID=A0A0E3PGH1_9EURY|nr:TIGR00295 family protein [Methanosarcina siciliae]AKB29939.1 metal-dependent phosphohydrolase [Methanosarcina siciliae T4/M]AKB33837.1 metal-dependent phosphohydrolase [Methanosarcina siciliae HI350]AKB38198.1 metal-dependent phosphohydrolase [Methanosarcina siciliae C2J]